jgi:two-component system nitrate/nitrite sensor histidine kinase NarX
MDPLGLKHALQSSIAAFCELTQVELAFDDQVPGLHLPVAQELQVLRIVQEALANIAKHARASRAWLTIARLHGDIDVVVEDDGAGVVPADGPGGSEHYGLDIMRQRAVSLGGTLDVGARAGGGTRVRLRFRSEPDRVGAP